jgi:nicotinate-nucleotide--dimethylbenzimidazole phosphoribosyltransferase
MVQHRLRGAHAQEQTLGRLEALAMQLARIPQPSGHGTELCFESPQLVVFASDHGLADEGVSKAHQDLTYQSACELLAGKSPASALAKHHGFDVTLVDAGVARHLQLPEGMEAAAPLLLRKIGYGTRNAAMAPAMSTAQARSALQAGMDVVRHLPGNVVALGSIGVAGEASAALLLSRLCGVPLSDACGKDQEADEVFGQRKLERLFVAASRHRRATSAQAALAAMGGFEIAMLCGAMIQAAGERRVVLVDGFVAGTAALVARALVPAVADYLVFAHRAAEPGHRLLLIHLQANPLLDMELRTAEGVGALLAWPLLQAAQQLLHR